MTISDKKIKKQIKMKFLTYWGNSRILDARMNEE